MFRHRQVRLSYPPAYVHLAILLARRHGRCRAAKALALPLSTIYRWLDAHGSDPQPAIGRAEGAEIAACIAACAAHGFDLRARIALLEPTLVPPAAANRGTGRTSSPARALALPGGAPPGSSAPGVGLHADCSTPADTSARLSPRTHARVQRARAMIDERYYAPLSCEYLAGIAGMSRFHFSRMFKLAFGVSPYRYLVQLRIRHARALLGSTAHPLGAVAAAVGFDSPSLLSKAFKSVEGISLARCFHGRRLGAPVPLESLAG